MKRLGLVTRIRPEGYENYKKLHANGWPEVLAMITECNLRNYSIFYHEGLLFSYVEYIGDDYEADMAKMAADPTTLKWWEACTPDFEPFPSANGGYWTEMESCFYLP